MNDFDNWLEMCMSLKSEVLQFRRLGVELFVVSLEYPLKALGIVRARLKIRIRGGANPLSPAASSQLQLQGPTQPQLKNNLRRTQKSS